MIPLARPTVPLDHYFQAAFVLFCDILKIGDGRTDRNMFENNDHYRPSGSIALSMTGTEQFRKCHLIVPVSPVGTSRKTKDNRRLKLTFLVFRWSTSPIQGR